MGQLGDETPPSRWYGFFRTKRVVYDWCGCWRARSMENGRKAGSAARVVDDEQQAGAALLLSLTGKAIARLEKPGPVFDVAESARIRAAGRAARMVSLATRNHGSTHAGTSTSSGNSRCNYSSGGKESGQRRSGARFVLGSRSRVRHRTECLKTGKIVRLSQQV